MTYNVSHLHFRYMYSDDDVVHQARDAHALR
jgi:hypothetical protein